MYEIGQSKKEAKNIIGPKSLNLNKQYRNPNSPCVEDLGLSQDVMPLQTYLNIQVWCGRLMGNSRKLDDEIDKFFNQVIELKDSAMTSKKELKNILKKLFALKSSIRNIEIDIEEFVNVCSITEHIFDSTLGSTTLQMLSQVNSSYISTYDLVIYKLKTISYSRVTITNIFISLTALAVSFIALFNR